MSSLSDSRCCCCLESETTGMDLAKIILDLVEHDSKREKMANMAHKLGEPDAAGHYSLEELLGNSYMAVSQAAQIIAFTGGDYLEDDDED